MAWLSSAFWGQSFVAELTRISAHGEKKLKLRRASLIKAQSQIQTAPAGGGDGQGSHPNVSSNNETSHVDETHSFGVTVADSDAPSNENGAS
jgi:phosphatidylethanolamine-binding protein (PEBP) family uncharacterized protein